MKKKALPALALALALCLACQSALAAVSEKVLSRAIEIIGQMESGHNYATVIVDSNGKISAGFMRAAGVKRENGCCIYRVRIYLTSYARRTGNAAASGHMRAKARLSAFKKRFSSCGIRQPAAQIYIFGGMQRSVSCPPARRR